MTTAPCPICGYAGETFDHDLADADIAWIACSNDDCCLSRGLPPDAWDELAKAVNVLAAATAWQQAIIAVNGVHAAEQVLLAALAD